MLIHFKVKNFLSFKDETILSLTAGKGRNFDERIYNQSRNKVLKFASLFGSNGSGKSNFIKAISFSKEYIRKKNDKAFIPSYYKLDALCKSKPSLFEYKFEIDSKVYTYGFEVLLSKNEVVSEWLYCNNPRSDKLVYKYHKSCDCNELNFEFGNFFKDKDLIMRLNIFVDGLYASNSPLFLTTINENKNSFTNYEKMSLIFDVYDWFLFNLKVKSPDLILSDYAYFMSKDNKKDILKFFNDFDLSISEYKLVEYSKDSLASKLPKELFDDLIADIEKVLANKESKNKGFMFGINDDFYTAELKDNEVILKTIQFYHNNSNTPFSMLEESDGTKKIFKLLEILFQKHDDITYIVDEIDRCLHPLLTYNFISAYLDKASKMNCQLVVTTHESNLLDFKLLRKDEVFFVSKDNGASNMQSMGTTNIRSDKKLSKSYLLGQIAVPKIKNDRYLKNNK